MRSKTINLCLQYHANVRLIHIEAPRSVLLFRNHHRDTSLNNKTLLAMLHKWQAPTAEEAHSLQFWQSSSSTAPAILCKQ